MKRHVAFVVALFGLVAFASLAHGDTGSFGGFGGRSFDSGNTGGILGGRSGGNSGSVSFNGNSERSSRNVDRWGGYIRDNRYWWNGGYWEGGCYGCGVWICIDCKYPSCPPCQWFNHRRWECEFTETCSQVTAGRKLL